MRKTVQDDIDEMVKKELIERKKKVYLTEKEKDELLKVCSFLPDEDRKNFLKDLRNLGRSLK